MASSNEDGITGLLLHEVGESTRRIVFAVCLSGYMLFVFRKQLLQALEATLFWGLIALLLVVGYSYRSELRDTRDRVMAELMPGYVAGQSQSVEVVRGGDGDFSITVHVNGAEIPMVLDTGATSVVLTPNAARAAGLMVDALEYNTKIDTANGRTYAASITLDRVDIGNLTEKSIPALVSRDGQLKHNLLGMSFLNRLESWEVRGDKLRMRGK
jgi:aspartyl protease family protein